MTSAVLQKLVGAKPFVPLRIYVSDGTVHDIRSRELIWVGTGMAVLVVPLPDQGDADKPLIERTIHLDLRPGMSRWIQAVDWMDLTSLKMPYTVGGGSA
jgi:hypothetical protein